MAGNRVSNVANQLLQIDAFQLMKYVCADSYFFSEDFHLARASQRERSQSRCLLQTILFIVYVTFNRSYWWKRLSFYEIAIFQRIFDYTWNKSKYFMSTLHSVLLTDKVHSQTEIRKINVPTQDYDFLSASVVLFSMLKSDLLLDKPLKKNWWKVTVFQHSAY